jgi:hypothetical protein
MRPFRYLALIAVALVLAGCSYRDGIYVIVRSSAASAMKSDSAAWLRARGFEIIPSQDDSGYSAIRDKTIGLHASFHVFEGKTSLFIGKGNSREFSADETTFMKEFALWLVAHADQIESGHASKASTSAEIREAFYAKIKKA